MKQKLGAMHIPVKNHINAQNAIKYFSTKTQKATHIYFTVQDFFQDFLHLVCWYV